MNKSGLFLTVLCVSLLAACGKKEETHAGNVINEPPILSASSGNVPDTNMPELARKYNCSACHAIDKKVLGPAWADVAKKYKGDAGAEAKLIIKVSKGGSGVWGTMPMPPNDSAGAKQADMKALVKFILGLAK
ncbi:MAG TPA: c-type cytochrome [Gallionella sp.]|nr:c-type cytochrome [Gallionella sp.]